MNSIRSRFSRICDRKDLTQRWLADECLAIDWNFKSRHSYPDHSVFSERTRQRAERWNRNQHQHQWLGSRTRISSCVSEGSERRIPVHHKIEYLPFRPTAFPRCLSMWIPYSNEKALWRLYSTRHYHEVNSSMVSGCFVHSSDNMLNNSTTRGYLVLCVSEEFVNMVCYLRRRLIAEHK